MVASFLIQTPGQRTASDTPGACGDTVGVCEEEGTLGLGQRQGALVPWASCMWRQRCLPKPAVLTLPGDGATTPKCR